PPDAVDPVRLPPHPRQDPRGDLVRLPLLDLLVAGVRFEPLPRGEEERAALGPLSLPVRFFRQRIHDHVKSAAAGVHRGTSPKLFPSPRLPSQHLTRPPSEGYTCPRQSNTAPAAEDSRRPSPGRAEATCRGRDGTEPARRPLGPGSIWFCVLASSPEARTLR